jgi:hypothetical protein
VKNSASVVILALSMATNRPTRTAEAVEVVGNDVASVVNGMFIPDGVRMGWITARKTGAVGELVATLPCEAQRSTGEARDLLLRVNMGKPAFAGVRKHSELSGIFARSPHSPGSRKSGRGVITAVPAITLLGASFQPPDQLLQSVQITGAAFAHLRPGVWSPAGSCVPRIIPHRTPRECASCARE